MPTISDARITALTGKITFSDIPNTAPLPTGPTGTQLVTPQPSVQIIPHNIYGFIPGTLFYGAEIFRVLFAQPVAFPVDWAGSLAVCAGAPSVDFILAININDVGAGALVFEAGSTDGVFSSLGANFALNIGDILSLVVQTDDPSFYDLLYTIVGVYV